MPDSAAEANSVLSEMLLFTNSWNFSPLRSGPSEVAMSGKTSDFLCRVLKKAPDGLCLGAELLGWVVEGASG